MLTDRQIERYRRQAIRTLEQQLDNNTFQTEDVAERMLNARNSLEAAMARAGEPLDPVKCPRCRIWDGKDVELVEDACPSQHCGFGG